MYDLIIKNGINKETAIFFLLSGTGKTTLSTDSKLLPVPLGKKLLGSKYSFMGDEHGKITLHKNSKTKPMLGETVFIQPTHCDPTVNLYNNCKIISNKKIHDIWNIDARGYL